MTILAVDTTKIVIAAVLLGVALLFLLSMVRLAVRVLRGDQLEPSSFGRQIFRRNKQSDR